MHKFFFFTFAACCGKIHSDPRLVAVLVAERTVVCGRPKPLRAMLCRLPCPAMCTASPTIPPVPILLAVLSA